MVYLRTYTLLLWKAPLLAERRPALPELSLLRFWFHSFPLSGPRWYQSLGAIPPNKHVSYTVDLTSIRNLAPVWVLSIVDLTLEAHGLSIELERDSD